MIVSIALALFNGVFISSSRAMNGQLSTEVGAFRASLWNHVVGFAFLSAVLAVLSGWKFSASAPPAAYLGGVFGALFVAVSSAVFPRLGTLNAGVLVIAGQMISAVVIDTVDHQAGPSTLRVLGVIIVLGGVTLTRLRAARLR